MWHFQKKHKISALISLSTGYTVGSIVIVTAEGQSASKSQLSCPTLVSEVSIRITWGTEELLECVCVCVHLCNKQSRKA